jgi:hypothetical protein
MSTVGASSDVLLARLSAALHAASSQAEICSSSTGFEALLISYLVCVICSPNAVGVLASWAEQPDSVAPREVLYFQTNSHHKDADVDLKEEA